MASKKIPHCAFCGTDGDRWTVEHQTDPVLRASGPFRPTEGPLRVQVVGSSGDTVPQPVRLEFRGTRG